MRIVQEMYARGFEFVPIDLYTAKAQRFQIVDGKLMPSLATIDGLGDKAADAVLMLQNRENSCQKTTSATEQRSAKRLLI